MFPYLVGAPLLVVALGVSVVLGGTGLDLLHDAYGGHQTSAHGVLGEGERPGGGDPGTVALGLGAMALALFVPISVALLLTMAGRGPAAEADDDVVALDDPGDTSGA